MKHVFIVNPISGHGVGKKCVPIIESFCKFKELDYEIIRSDYAGHAKEITQTYFSKNNVCIYAVGGDGTANEVLNGLNDGVQMAIIPAGSGNDFFASYSPKEFTLKEIIETTIDGVVVELDYGTANDFRFLNTVSVGFDAQINYMMNVKYRNNRLIPSQMMYIYAALANVFKPKPLPVEFIVDGQKHEGVALLLAVANGLRYGGGFKPAPMAKINDGLFDICLIDFVKTGRIIRLLPVYYRGEHVNLDIANFYMGSVIIIKAKETMFFNVDGEVMESKEMTICIQRRKLNMRVSRASLKRLEYAED